MINNLNHIPLLRLLLPFIVGIIGVIYLQPDLTIILGGFGFVLLLLFTTLLIKKINSSFKLRWVIGILIYTSLVLGGAILTSLQYKNTQSSSEILTKNNNQLFIGEIIEPTQKKAKSITYSLANEGGNRKMNNM